MCWRDHERDHKILFKSVDANDSEEIIEDEDSSESDVEDNSERAQIWFWWFWWCWFERRDSVLRILLRIVLRREKFFSFYTAEWKMNFEKWRAEHDSDNESDRRLLDRKEWDVIDFRRSRLLHFLLTYATVLVSNIMRFFTYCAFCSDDKHLTNVFLMIWFFASIAFWDRKTLIFDVIISSAIVALFDFAVTKESFARVNFVVSDEMSLNDCVDRLDEDEFQHDADLFVFVENDFLQSSHVNNFFRSQF